jgi:hypothetical protein
MTATQQLLNVTYNGKSALVDLSIPGASLFADFARYMTEQEGLTDSREYAELCNLIELLKSRPGEDDARKTLHNKTLKQAEDETVAIVAGQQFLRYKKPSEIAEARIDRIAVVIKMLNAAGGAVDMDKYSRAVKYRLAALKTYEAKMIAFLMTPTRVSGRA